MAMGYARHRQMSTLPVVKSRRQTKVGEEPMTPLRAEVREAFDSKPSYVIVHKRSSMSRAISLPSMSKSPRPLTAAASSFVPGGIAQKAVAKRPATRELTMEDQMRREAQAYDWFHKARELNQQMMNADDLDFTVADVHNLRKQRANGAERLVQKYFLRKELKRKEQRRLSLSKNPAFGILAKAEHKVSVPKELDLSRMSTKESLNMHGKATKESENMSRKTTKESEQLSRKTTKESESEQFNIEAMSVSADSDSEIDNESGQAEDGEFYVNPNAVKLRMAITAVQGKLRSHNLLGGLSEGIKKHREEPLQERLKRHKMQSK